MEIHAVNIRAKRVLPFHSDADIFSRIAACRRSRPRVDGHIDRHPSRPSPSRRQARCFRRVCCRDSSAPLVPSPPTAERQSDEATRT